MATNEKPVKVNHVGFLTLSEPSYMPLPARSRLINRCLRGNIFNCFTIENSTEFGQLPGVNCPKHIPALTTQGRVLELAFL